MILELRDFTGEGDVTCHVPMPAGMTLGEAFDRHPDLARVARGVAQAYVNNVAVHDWRALSPNKNDRVRLMLKPQGGALAFIGASTLIQAALANVTLGGFLTFATAAFSLLSFGRSLFARPKTPSPKRKDNTVYGFEGIKTSYVPGDPIPVPYGQNRMGGQALGVFVDVTSSGRRQELSMLVGLGEGNVTEISCFRVNEVAIENISSIVAESRLGLSSQAVIDGFETIRNTFFDGREIASGTPIVYTTNTQSLVTVQLNVGALEGMVHNTADGDREPSWTEISVERRPVGQVGWTIVTSPERFTGNTRAPIWFPYKTSVDTPDDYDFRLAVLRSRKNNSGPPSEGSRTKGRLWLSNVSEISGRQEPYSGTALASIKALATSQLQGAVPDLSIVVRGREVRRYTSPTAFVTEYNRVPAWHVLDYLTNSRYGMGLANSQMDLQSFIDFADLCNSLVPDGKGGTEVQFQHDRVINERQPHWDHVNDMLGLYRSAVIYSQERYRVISDRQDLPVRQVFHAGNMVPDGVTVRIGLADPNKSNYVRANFFNEALDYNRDMVLVDSIAAGESMRDYDINLIGIARESEAERAASWDLQRRTQLKREIEFTTGLEGIVVEPGDRCRVGIPMTDWEMGYGGRALDGSLSHLTCDREFEVSSGFTYDLFVWHTLADTLESRTLANTVTGTNARATYITASPTAAFDFAVRAGDRWAIGINSEDLMLATVKRVERNEDGTTMIEAEEYRTATVVTAAPKIRLIDGDVPLGDSVAQPMGVSVTEETNLLKDGTWISKVFVDVSPSPPFEGGRVTVPGTIASVTLAQSHNPNAGALHGEQLRFLEGPASGTTRMITAWGGDPTRVATVSPTFASAPNSGDAYTLIKHGGECAGFDLSVRVGSDNDFGFSQTVYGTIATYYSEAQSSQEFTFNITPFNRAGQRNNLGTWVRSLTTYGDTVAPNTPSGFTTFLAGSGLVLLDWDDNPDRDLSHYALYRNAGNSFGAASLLGEMMTSRFIDRIPNVGSNYYYWIRAVDASSNISPVHPASNAGVAMF